MTSSTFAEYALSSNLTVDGTYAVELLIDLVRSNFDASYWDDWQERIDARRSPNYKPTFCADHVEPASEELKSLSWVSLRRLGDNERPVRDIGALRFLPNLSGLTVMNNQVTDLSPLASCSKLGGLDLNKNPIRDISPLAKCQNIQVLSLRDCPISNLSVLEVLPKLRELSISADQIAAFRRLRRLPHLRKIEFEDDTFESFDGFPKMPELSVIRGARVYKLDGLQHFQKLQNLVDLSGRFDSLEPLQNLHGLTHVSIGSSRVKSFQSLAGLPALRDLYINTDAQKLDLSPLESLAALHELNVRCKGAEPNGLDKLKSSLSPWDNEFRAAKPRYTPSLELHVVDQKTFDIYDTRKRFNDGGPDKNEGLLLSELKWLEDQLERLLAADFHDGDDYTIPLHWNGARSRAICLYSDKSVAAFPKLVLGIQEVLSNAKQDWIIYLETEEVQLEFVVWIYPDKIVVTYEHAESVRSLVGSQ